MVSPLAGKPAPESILANIPRLVTSYYALEPDASVAAQRVAFGTSGHRGTSLECSFNEEHILAITQAICIHRQQNKIDGPLFLGIDTHALSEPAFATALEVLAANGVEVMIDDRDGFTPTPAVSHAILTYNRGKKIGLADGIVITPSHNPPEDGGFKYNPPSGGPADSATTKWIQDTANGFIAAGVQGVKRIPFARAVSSPTTHRHNYMDAYIGDLATVIDFDAIRAAHLKLGVDPLGGAGVKYWDVIAERYKIPLTVVNEVVDATFRFMTVDWDGKIRMDCSSPYAMAGMIAMKDRFDVAWACDTDHDRHGIVACSTGLLNPNHYLSVAIEYLFTHRPGWSKSAAVGKSVVCSSMIDRVAKGIGRALKEVPVGFKWFVDGLLDGSLGFGGEESAGASFLRRDGTVDDRQGRNHHGAARRGDDGRHRQGSGRALPGSHATVWQPRVRAHRRGGDGRAEENSCWAQREGCGGDAARGRKDHRHPDDGAGHQRSDWRTEGDIGRRLVRGAPVGNRRDL